MRACIGTTTPALELPEEIAATDVRRFLDLIGETNPLYRDQEYASRLGHGAASCRRCWSCSSSAGSTIRKAAKRASTDWPGLTLPANYTNTRNAGHEFTWLQPVYVGDRLTLQSRLTDMYVKQGRRGVPVIYLVRETEIRNQAGGARRAPDLDHRAAARSGIEPPRIRCGL